MNEAADWWEENRSAAPNALQEDLARALLQIGAHPYSGQLVVGSHRQGVRRIPLRHTRYFVYFQVSRDEIEIVALWHASRGTLPPLDQ